MPEQTTYFLLRSTDARKVGQRGTGKIKYELLCDEDHQSVFIRIVGNEGGGYFSREKIDFDRARQCITGEDGEHPFPSKVFGDAFVGRSSNNAGFLAAVLRAEGLLDAAPGTDFHHIVSGNWAAWKSATLALQGPPLIEAARIEPLAESIAASKERGESVPEHKEHTKDPKTRKNQTPVKRQ